MTERNAMWWLKCVVHNMVIHPLLPAADLIDTLGFKRLPALVYRLHDTIVPTGGG
jgi:hypothetical protein